MCKKGYLEIFLAYDSDLCIMRIIRICINNAKSSIGVNNQAHGADTGISHCSACIGNSGPHVSACQHANNATASSRCLRKRIRCRWVSPTPAAFQPASLYLGKPANFFIPGNCRGFNRRQFPQDQRSLRSEALPRPSMQVLGPMVMAHPSFFFFLCQARPQPKRSGMLR
jgi:hypothetical protein